jgi:hypothetical protein
MIVWAVGIDENVPPAGIHSLYAYPNPFNESFSIDFELKENTDLCVEVYNMLGYLIKSIPQSYYTSGRKSIDIFLSGQEAGLYYVRIIDAEGKVAHAMVQKL